MGPAPATHPPPLWKVQNVWTKFGGRTVEWRVRKTWKQTAIKVLSGADRQTFAYRPQLPKRRITIDIAVWKTGIISPLTTLMVGRLHAAIVDETSQNDNPGTYQQQMDQYPSDRNSITHYPARAECKGAIVIIFAQSDIMGNPEINEEMR